MSDNVVSSDASKSVSTPKYIHPIDLLRYRLGQALEEADNLVELTVGNYELYYYEHDGRSMCGARLRADAYCNDPKQVFCHEAHHALHLAMPTAVGIGEWLQYGMGDRSGTFETGLRASLDVLNLRVQSFPSLPFVPVLTDGYASWKASLATAWKLNDELSNVAVESYDLGEWKKTLQDAIDTILLLDAEFEGFCSAATDLETDMEKPYAALVAAMPPVAESIDKIAPRLLYGSDDSEELEWLTKHLRHLLTQCAGSLKDGKWRYPPQELFQQLPRQASTDPPKEFQDAWGHIQELGDYIECALGDSSASVAPPDLQMPLEADLTTTGGTERPCFPDFDDLVTLDQMSAVCGLSKRTLERHKSKLPVPDAKGGGGKADKWFWRNARPSLELLSNAPLPEKFPGSRIR